MQPDPHVPDGPQQPWQSGQQQPQPQPGAWQQPQPPAPQKKRSPLLIVLIVVGAVILLCCVGVVAVAAFRGAEPPKVEGHTIRFEVTAEGGKASLINWSTLEDSSVLNDTATPWSHEVRLEQKLGLVGVNASTADGGKVACKLFVDGKLVDEGESAGVVNCSATVE